MNVSKTKETSKKKKSNNPRSSTRSGDNTTRPESETPKPKRKRGRPRKVKKQDTRETDKTTLTTCKKPTEVKVEEKQNIKTEGKDKLSKNSDKKTREKPNKNEVKVKRFRGRTKKSVKKRVMKKDKHQEAVFYLHKMISNSNDLHAKMKYQNMLDKLEKEVMVF
jgi:hypothetical protein